MTESEPSSPKTESSDLLPEVYEELRQLAHSRMNQENSPQTLSATALVHEAYLRVSKNEESPRWSNKRHFFGAAAEAMRRILIDRARAKRSQKRGGELNPEELCESQIIAPVKDDEILAVDEALEELEKVDSDSAELVKLRYFSGMSWAEIADATGISDRTVRRHWKYTKTWLRERLDRN